MAEFVFAYRMPKNYQIGDEATREAWQAWFASMGDDLLDVGKPAKAAETVGRSGNATQLGGFSIIRANSAEEALEIAGRCPGLASGGGVEVGTLVNIR
jgi:YCII-related domain